MNEIVFKKRNALLYATILPLIGIIFLYAGSFLIQLGIEAGAFLSLIGVPFILIGLYVLYWFPEVTAEFKKYDKNAPNPWTIVFIILFSMFGSIAIAIIMFSLTPILGIIMYIIFYLIILIWWTIYIIKFSKSVNKITNGEISTIIAFLLLWLLPIIGIPYIQSKLNNFKGEIKNSNKYFNEDNSQLSQEEINCKQYIEQYKSQYSKEQIKNGLVSANYNEDNVNNYLNKYFNQESRFLKDGEKHSHKGIFILVIILLIIIVLPIIGIIYNFVDYDSLLPNKVELNNGLRASAADSIANSNTNEINIFTTYTGSRLSQIIYEDGYVENKRKERCQLENIKNLNTGIENKSVNFLNGQQGLLTFKCANLIQGEEFEGNILVNMLDPKTNLKTPSTGIIRLNVN